MSGETKLAPCPFCGGEAELVFNSPAIFCKQCRLQVLDTEAYDVEFASANGVVKKWTSRPEVEKEEEKYVCYSCNEEVSPFDSDHYQVCKAPKKVEAEPNNGITNFCPICEARVREPSFEVSELELFVNNFVKSQNLKKQPFALRQQKEFVVGLKQLIDSKQKEGKETPPQE